MVVVGNGFASRSRLFSFRRHFGKRFFFLIALWSFDLALARAAFTDIITRSSSSGGVFANVLVDAFLHSHHGQNRPYDGSFSL